MHLNLSSDVDELSDLYDSVQRLLAVQATFTRRRAAVATPSGWDHDLWQALAALGTTALCLPGSCNGFDRSLADWGEVQRLMGRSLALTPALPAVLCAAAWRHPALLAHQPSWLSTVADGRKRLAWAHDEPDTRHAPWWVSTRARQDDQGRWQLTGQKYPVLYGADADAVIVSARGTGLVDDIDGVGLFLLDADAQGMQRRPLHLIDDQPAASLHLQDTPATLLVCPATGMAASVINAVQRAGQAACCADMVGAMEQAYQLTLNHVSTRQQFGRPLADNQAVRHQIADMVVHLEAARSMAMLAAATADDPLYVDDVDPYAAPLDLLRAKLVVGQAARALCHTAIQLHGALGMSDECAVGHCLRRIVVNDQLFGDSSAHAAAIGDRLAQEARHA